MLDAIYKRKLKNIVYGNALSLNRYGNVSLKFLLTIFSHWLSLGGMVVWTPLVCYVLYYNVESLDQAFNTCYEIVSVALIGIVHFWEEENATMRELLRITTIYKNAIILIFSSSKGPHQLKQCIIFGWTLFIL